MDDVTAPGVPITVVACKRPGHWILRGIGVFTDANALRQSMQPLVCLVDADDLEWTHHTYLIPHYLAYGQGEQRHMGWPEVGVFLYEHQGNGVYGSDAKRPFDTKGGER